MDEKNLGGILTEETAKKLIKALEDHSNAMYNLASTLEEHANTLGDNISAFGSLSESINGLSVELYHSGISSLADEIRQIREPESNSKKTK